MKYKEQRVGIFVDVQNLYHSAKNLYKARVNYKELMKSLISERKLIRAFAYVVKSDTALGESSFFEALKNCGMELRLKDLQIFAGGTKKADWDVGMAVDAIRLADSLDAVILVTGDGDFIPLIIYLQQMGKSVEVAAFGKSASGKMKELADEFIDLDEVPKMILKK
ncbi:MAG: NYN domain-containing protein [Candidatus Pacebacteria bacterium]|nr:NYN domain-containing protein [Candidatus Paceibacterota bacterium]